MPDPPKQLSILRPNSLHSQATTVRVPTVRVRGADKVSLADQPQRMPSIDKLCLNLPTKLERPDELAGRLALLLHARECCKTDVSTCSVPSCEVARGVLDHCLECSMAHGRCHTSCSQAKTLLRHFRLCRARETDKTCPICRLLSSEHSWALKHTHSITPLQLGALTPSDRVTAAASSIGPASLRRAASDESNLRIHRPPFTWNIQATKRQRVESTDEAALSMDERKASTTVPK